MAEPAVPNAELFPEMHAYLHKVEQGDSLSPEEADRFLQSIAIVHRDVDIRLYGWWRTSTSEFILAIFLGALVFLGIAMVWNFFHAPAAPREIDCSACISQGPYR